MRSICKKIKVLLNYACLLFPMEYTQRVEHRTGMKCSRETEKKVRGQRMEGKRRKRREEAREGGR